ncbi:hypothetical protein CORC01_09066 [Colletotrichum orchidophilum]|uniref:Uncharacterized protein n=1 Tax=Colletotrichum orchidophilum TaxID=1209926 RepID=A0A1G4B2L9_9PEZI|nr:uncharacterized protein CORC01_09066 [Colletotrichum orchidophilum]OHE95634.1 hypothetical protein CORC01_09066 [Colletotrichum orchidophilum]
MMPKRPNDSYRTHRGYYREDDDLTVTEGAIQRERKDWSTYRKTDTFIAIFGAIFIATLLGGAIAVGIYYATGGSPNSQVGQGSNAHIVPRFAGMKYNSNGTQTHGMNSTLSGMATTGTTTLCEDEADETITVTQFLGNTKTASVDTTITTYVQMTLTQTLHKSTQGTTVSSAKPVNATLSGSSIVSLSIPVVTEVITTSVTETEFHTATAHQSNVASESSIASTSEAASEVESSSAQVTSVFLTKTLTQTRKTTVKASPMSTSEEFSSTTTVTPTTVIESTIYVTAEPPASSTQAQCSLEVEDHTVYVTVTETVTPSPSGSLSAQSKTSKTSSKTSSSLAPLSDATDTISVTYTVTIDSLTPPTNRPIFSRSSSKTSSTLISHSKSKSTVIVTQVATQTFIVSIGNGTTVSSQLAHVGTPIFTNLPSSGTAQASIATDVVVITKTITSNVFQTVSASSSSPSADVQTDTQTSVVTVTAIPSSSSSESSQSGKSLITTIYLTDRATQTVTIGGMATVTVRPEQSNSSVSGPSNSTGTETKVITKSVSRVVHTRTTTVSGKIFTSLITVYKNVTATATVGVSSSLSGFSNTTVTATATATSVFELPVTVNTTIYITGTPMMHPTAPSTSQPLFSNGTAATSSTSQVLTTYYFPTLTSTVTEQPMSTSTVVVVSGADKHAEAIMGGCKSCTILLAIFVLGLMVLF